MRVLYIDIDSLRPDHLSCYGYLRPTSPHIDSIAAEGIRFTNFYASDTPCLPSRTAFFGGMLGIHTGVVNHGGPYADLPIEGHGRSFRPAYSQNTLASVLRRAGYHTASISPFPARHGAYQIWYGFHEMVDTGKYGDENADEVYPFVQRWLRLNGQRDNWFLHVNLWDPHTPYDTPESFGNPFAEMPLESWITQELIDQQNESFGPHSALEVPGFGPYLPAVWRRGVGQIKTVADAKLHMDGYDTGIRYADEYIGRILADLQALGIAEETAVVLSADHGENQGELNVWGDHQTADYITNRLPLIIRWPGVTGEMAGMVDDSLHYHLDLTATLVDLLGGEQPAAWDGVPFSSVLNGTQTGRDYLVLSHGAWSCQRSVRWDEWLFIRTYHTGLKDFPAYMLFDVTADPHQLTNLAAKRPDVLGDGLRLLDEWVGTQMAQAWRGDPFWGIIAEGGPFHANIHSAEWDNYLERLRHTGRGRQAQELATLNGRPFTSGLD